MQTRSAVISNIDSAAYEMETKRTTAIPNAVQVSFCLKTPKSTCSSNPMIKWVNGAVHQCRVGRWWARPELNRRSSPCEGDVITPRPRARWFPGSSLKFNANQSRFYVHTPDYIELRWTRDTSRRSWVGCTSITCTGTSRISASSSARATGISIRCSFAS